MGTETYRPADVTCILSGRSIKDFPEDTFVRIRPRSEGTRLTKGVKDQSAWTEDARSDAEVEIVIMASGADNDFLSTLYNRQRRGIEGDKVLLIEDLSGRTLLSSASCRIKNFTEQEFGGEVGNNTWTLLCAKAERFVGGNNPR